MSAHRKQQVEQLITQSAADFLARESNRQSLITITRTSISPDFKNATVYFTVLPQEHEDHALAFVKRNVNEFRRFIKKHMHLKTLPFFSFVVDEGEKHRQRLDDLSSPA